MKSKGNYVNYLRSFGLLTTALVVFACGGGGAASPAPATPAPATPAAATPAAATPVATAQPTTPPVTERPATETPTEAATEAPTVAPGSSLDPSASDAGVVGQVTISNDTRANRDGTYEIIGIADNGFGSGCTYSFEGDELTTVAWYDAAPDGQIHQMATTIKSDDVPTADGESNTGISDGRVYIDFVSETGFGTAYTGDPTDPEHGGSVTIDASLSGDVLTLAYVGKTWDLVDYSGQMLCGDFGR
jgi:hypothetical protein